MVLDSQDICGNPDEQDRLWKSYISRFSNGFDEPFSETWSAWLEIYANRTEEQGPPQAWLPDDEQIQHSNIRAMMQEVGCGSYELFHQWSVKNKHDFYRNAIDRLGIVFKQNYTEILDLAEGPTAPRWLAGAKMNCIDSCLKAVPERKAIVYCRENATELRAVTYGELKSLTAKVASGLINEGFKPGDAVALYMPMNVECVAAYLGIVMSGCTVVSIADSFSPAEVAKRLEISGASGIITVEKFIRSGKTFDLYAKVKQANSPRAIIISDKSSLKDLRPGDIKWEDFLGQANEVKPVECDPYDVTNILFSSGTTGIPKAIPWTHVTPVKCAMDGYLHQDIHPEDVVAWPTNIGWMMGPWLIYATFINNATMALYEGTPAGEGFMRFVQEARVTVLGTVPSLVRVWRSVNEQVDWKHIRVFSSTGEPSNVEDYLWLMSRSGFRAPVIEYCGGTEIGGGYITGTVVQPASPATFTTPAAGLDFVILDENNEPVSEGEMGEIFIVPPAMGLSQTLINMDHSSVYYRGCPSGPNGEILRRHGDQIMRLHKGFFRAQGRADDTMNLGGIKVSSIELEEVVSLHPTVYECAAVAVHQEDSHGDSLIVFIVLETDIDTEVLKHALNKTIAENLNPLFKIRELIIINSLPRTASNKLMRRKLRDQYTQMKRTDT